MIRRNALSRAALASALTVLCVAGAVTCAGAATGVADIVAKMPAGGAAEGRKLAARIVELGPGAVTEICRKLHEPGRGDDTKARTALHGLAFYVTRPGADAERSMVEGALVDALGALETRTRPDVKAFLVRQIQLVGADAAVGALARLLTDDRLCEPATQALVQIGTRTGTARAAAALRGALREASRSAKSRDLVTIVRALGRLRDGPSAGAVRSHARSADRELRRAAWYALANIGDASAVSILARAAGAEGYDGILGTKYYLLLARRLGEGGGKMQCARICRELIRTRTGDSDRNVVCAALATMARALGEEAADDVFAAVETDDVQVREAALRLAEGVPGRSVTERLVAKAQGAAPEVRAAVIAMLGRRGDRTALPAVAEALRDRDESVRLAAVTALAGFGPEAAVGPLVKMMESDKSGEVEAAKKALSVMKGEGFTSAVAAAIPGSSPAGRAALIELLAARKATGHAEAVLRALSDGDGKVRLAAARALGEVAGATHVSRMLTCLSGALHDEGAAERSALVTALAKVCRKSPDEIGPVLDALRRARGEERTALVKLLSRIGGAEALRAVVGDMRRAEARDAAVRALADWPDDGAAPELLKIAREAGSVTHRVLALRGYVRVVGLPSDRPPSRTAAMLKDAVSAARTASEKKLVLGALGKVKSAGAVEIAASFLDEAELREEAAAAVVAIACPSGGDDRGLSGAAVRDALGKVVAVTTRADLREKARTQLASLSSPYRATAVNLAKGRPVEASVPSEGGRRPERAVDGNTDRNAAWFGAGSPAWLRIDLGQAVKVGAVRVFFYWDGGRYYQYTVEVSRSGESWKKVVDRSRTTEKSTEKGFLHAFDPVEARYVRLNVLKNSANPSVHVSEVEVYGEGGAPAAETAGPAPQAAPAPMAEPDAEGFIPLLNGKDLTGWVGSTSGYAVEDGVLVCKRKGGGKLFTEREYADFVLKFDFKLTPGANNGLGIRTPIEGNPAYAGMELQILDNTSPRYAKLKPCQYHGSIYCLVAAKRGHLKPVGEWNSQEVRAIGRKITVVLNGVTIVDADLAEVEKRSKHAGIRRTSGHIGFLGHGARVEFRNIKIRPVPPYTSGPHNVPPEGFVALFNGKDLTGWKGLVGNPKTRAKMSQGQLAAEQRKADGKMRAHWKVVDGALAFDGKGSALCTARDYGDFEMLVDWKIAKGGDSGIYLRGSPQVQIWDTARRPEGSGGLYNNKRNPRRPSKCADNPVGQWSRFRIKMVGERVTVWLNETLVVDDVVMENYWDGSKPIYPTGQIELQNHHSPLWFRNVFIREIPRQ